jgi:predicted ATPase/DNA-binding XRE family transcriptional regulator
MGQAGSNGFGVLLKRLRQAAGLSQEALAERARMSAKGVSALESGARRAPYRETVDALLEVLQPDDDQRSQLLAAADRARVRGSPTNGATAPNGATAHRLPIVTTSLVGRDDQIASVRALLARNRLVTLAGPAGVGKTRLALGAANDPADEWNDGAWFVDLAPVSSPAGIPDAVASALGVARAGEARTGGDVRDRLFAHVASRAVLIILDNCEHLLDGVSTFARAALEHCSNARLLCTSRESLRTMGEIVDQVDTLAFPPAGSTLLATEVLRYPAAELFVDRATAFDATFAPTDANAPAVGEIVRRLDGLPLAIELAAARVRALGVDALAERLDQRLRLLVAGDRAAPERQQTLRASLQWSYDLLTVEERSLFRRLGIFVGGWTLAAAEYVCDAAGAGVVADGLASLVDKSLVTVSGQRGDVRYGFLESTRALSLELISSAEHEAAARAHVQWVAIALQRAYDDGAIEAAQATQSNLLPEIDNVRAALAWCDRNEEFPLGGRIAGLLADLFYSNGLSEEGSTWVERSLQRVSADAHPDIVARLCCALTRLSDDHKTQLAASERAVALAEEVGDDGLLAAAHIRHTVALYALGKVDEALAANDRARAVLRRHPVQPNRRLGWVLQHRAWISMELGDLDGARRCVRGSLRIFRRLNDEREVTRLSSDLAELEFAAGRPEQALEIVDASLSRVADQPALESVFMCNRAGYLLSLGDIVEAELTAREAIELAQRTQSPERAQHAIEHLAAAVAVAGKSEKAALLHGFVSAAYARSGYRRETSERSSYDLLVHALEKGLARGDLARLCEEGAELTLDEAVDEALLLPA